MAKSNEPIYDLMYKEVKKHMGGRGYFTDDNFKGMLRSRRLFLVMDGMDELPTKQAKEVFLKEVKDFCEENHKATGVLFTSRSERDVESVSFGSIRVFRMDKLTEEEIHQLGKNIFLEMGSERDQDTFYVRVSDLSDEIRCNPLLLTQLAVIYGNGEEIPDDIVGIFDKVNELILRTPISVTPPCEELREENIGGLLKRFAYEKYNHSQVADEKIFAYILRNKYPNNAKEMAKICLKYLKERSIYVDGKFLHKMLLEYFTAVSYYEAIFDDFDDFIGGDKLKELFSHYSDLYWMDMIRLFLIKADNAAEDDSLEKLYEEILKGDITEYTLLLDTATNFLNRKDISTEAVCLDILKKSTSGEYPAYGPLFWYIPEYELYESLVKSAEKMKGECKALALTRDVCCLNGKYTLKEVTHSVDGEKLFARGKVGLLGTRLPLCELFYTGKTEKEGDEVYPRLFDLAETKALMTGGCGFYGRREKLFSDELGLYTPTQLPLLGGEYIGFLTLPNNKETAEAELKKHSCKKVRAVSFINTESKTFGYINFYRCNVKHLYLPENAKELEKYWDSFLSLERKAFCGDNGIWYRALNRKICIVPQEVTEIEDSVFENDKIVNEIHLPVGLQEIGPGAFLGCSSLAEINLPEGIKEIGDYSFKNCSSLKEIYLSDGLQKIGWNAFEGCCSLSEIYLPEELKIIGFFSFANCSSLTKIHLPEGLQEIGDYSFKNCSSLKEIYLPDGLQKIECNAFYDCSSLTKISLPFYVSLEGLSSDVQIEVRGEKKETEWSKITSYSFPEGVDTIEEEYFQDCSNLVEVRLPESLKEIGARAFSSCWSLTEISLPEGLQKIGWEAFADCCSLTEIHLPKGLKEIEKSVFSYCSSLTEIYPPEGLQKIGERAFEFCSSLVEINLPEGLQRIEESAFAYCIDLKEIHLPKGLQEIGCGVFEFCSSLTEINLPEELQKIGERAFFGCDHLSEINLPRGVKAIGWSAFDGCSSLAEINLPERLQKIGERAFDGCSSLAEINLPRGVKAIGWSAFENCSSLAEINLPERLQKIGERAFDGCSSLAEINLPDG